MGTKQITKGKMTVRARPSVDIVAGNRVRRAVLSHRERRKEAIDARMRELGLTMTRISHDTGIDLSYVSRIISGARMPALDTTMRLARALHWSVEELAAVLIPDLDLTKRHIELRRIETKDPR